MPELGEENSVTITAPLKLMSTVAVASAGLSAPVLPYRYAVRLPLDLHVTRCTAVCTAIYIYILNYLQVVPVPNLVRLYQYRYFEVDLPGHFCTLHLS